MHLIDSIVRWSVYIILQLTRRDIKQGIKLTYLFDAKYRIGDTQDNVDTPPYDAINQMHRYRDAIYYIDQDTKQLKKEVIGGYILFPGNGEDSAVEEMNFYKSIGKVNIGAFPLRPQDNEVVHGIIVDSCSSPT